MTKIRNKKNYKYAALSFVAFVDSIVAVALVYPNDFAPDGVQGIAAMLQHVSGVSAGILTILINAPLLVYAFFMLDRGYAVMNTLYTAALSAGTVAIQQIIRHYGLHMLEVSASGTEALLIIAMIYGAVSGISYSIAVILGGSTGGVDVLASIITRRRPHFNTVWVLFAVKAAIACASYFVYGRRAMPVIVGIVCSFTGGFVSDNILKGRATALKFEVITNDKDTLSSEIMNVTGHGCTSIPAFGMYEGAERTMLICIVNKRERVDIERIISKYPGTFAYCCPVKCTYGEFDR